jgi:hypothetical protein
VVIVKAPNCTDALIEQTRLAYFNFIAAQPGVVAPSVAVNVTCTQLVRVPRGCWPVGCGRGGPTSVGRGCGARALKYGARLRDLQIG